MSVYDFFLPVFLSFLYTLGSITSLLVLTSSTFTTVGSHYLVDRMYGDVPITISLVFNGILQRLAEDSGELLEIIPILLYKGEYVFHCKGMTDGAAII